MSMLLKSWIIVCSIIHAKINAVIAFWHAINILLFPIQTQPNTSDCGVFAIAFTMAICNGQNPEEISFFVPRMRRHLKQCLEEGVMRHFPSKPRTCRRRTKRIEELFIFCHCRLQEEGNMCACHKCHEWFHNTCDHIPSDAWTDESYQWACSNCN